MSRDWYLSDVEKNHADETHRRIAGEMLRDRERRHNMMIYGQVERPKPEWKWWLKQIFGRRK